ncbi:MAG TPA: hypothetical protein VLA09_05365 [Longimicrobiales bacterium]|nr:hypothetical protein [Longimicrobiales bacterium]
MTASLDFKSAPARRRLSAAGPMSLALCGALSLIAPTRVAAQAPACSPAGPSGPPPSLLPSSDLSPCRFLWTAAPQEPPSSQHSVLGPVLGGALGGVAGTAIGLGLVLNSDCYESECIPLLLVPLVLEPVGMALGTHLGNRGRGSLPRDLLVSALALGAGLWMGEALASRTGEDGALAVAFALQLVAVVWSERSSSR